MMAVFKSLLAKNILSYTHTYSHMIKLTPFSTTFCFQREKTSTPPIKTVDKLVVNKNMTLRYCHPVAGASAATNRPTDDGPKKRPLVVLFAWMVAKEKHIEKYRDLYLQHGFDTLTVKTSPIELLLPTRGSQRIARNVVEFLNSSVKQYPDVVIHAFSVGAYQFGEVLVQMEKKENANVLTSMQKCIKGMIFDSAADLQAIPNGLSRALTNNRILARILRTLIDTHLKVCYSFATRHYATAQNAFHHIVLRCPALLLVSNDDAVGNPAANERVMNEWKKLGNEVYWKCWDDSSHVGHLHKYPKEYETQVNNFLKQVKLI